MRFMSCQHHSDLFSDIVSIDISVDFLYIFVQIFCGYFFKFAVDNTENISPVMRFISWQHYGGLFSDIVSVQLDHFNANFTHSVPDNFQISRIQLSYLREALKTPNKVYRVSHFCLLRHNGVPSKSGFFVLLFFFA